MQSAGVPPENENGVVTKQVALLKPGLPRPNKVVPMLKKFAEQKLMVFGAAFPCKNITTDHFQAASQRTCAALSSRFLIPLLTMWAAAFVGTPLGGRLVLGVVVANRSGDHPMRTRTWRHSSEALKRFLRGGCGYRWCRRK